MTTARRASVTISPIPIVHSIQSIPLSSPPILSSPTGFAFGSARSIDADIAAGSLRARTLSGTLPQQGKALNPFLLESAGIKILLLENVSPDAVQMLTDNSYVVDQVKSALGEEELIKRLKEGKYQAVGVRSKTRVTARVIKECPSVRYRRLLHLNCDYPTEVTLN